MGVPQNVHSATGEWGVEKSDFFAYVICGWPPLFQFNFLRNTIETIYKGKNFYILNTLLNYGEESILFCIAQAMKANFNF